jgi:hypothetical protein
MMHPGAVTCQVCGAGLYTMDGKTSRELDWEDERYNELRNEDRLDDARDIEIEMEKTREEE